MCIKDKIVSKLLNEKDSFKLLRLFSILLLNGVVGFDELALLCTQLSSPKTSVYLRLITKLGGRVLSETQAHYIIELEDLTWRVRKNVSTDLKFGVLLNIVGEPYQYWKWFDRCLNNAKTFIDVGAYIGGYSVRACHRNVDVYAVEANPENYELLKKNLKMNCRHAIVCTFNVAAGSRKEMKALYYGVSEDRFLTSSLVRQERDMVGRIKVTPLDAIIPYSRMRRPVLIKIDVEGFEINVLKGAMRTLQNSDYVMIETSKENKLTVNKIITLLNFETIDYYKSYTFWRRMPK